MTAHSDQRKHGALRISALENPAATRYFNRWVENLAARSLHALHGLVDVSGVEIIKPEWDRHRSRLVKHAADRLPRDGEQLIRAQRTGIRLFLLPAKERAIKAPRAFPIAGDELVPADAAGRVQVGGRCIMLRKPFEQSDGCHLRIDDDRKAADIGDLFRRNVYAAAKLVRARGGAIDIVYADISEPARPKPRLRRVRGQ